MLDENELVAFLCDYLVTEGYQITQRLSTKQKGIDIIAKNPASSGRLLIEAKGGASSRASNNNKRKNFTAPQSLNRVAKALYTAAALYSHERQDRDEIALAFPHTARYVMLLNNILPLLKELKVRIFLVGLNGKVMELN